MTTWVLTKSSMWDGGRLTRQRLGLVVLLYAFNLGVSLLIAFPVYLAIVEHVGSTGFGADLIQAFDLVVWREVMAGLADTLKALWWQLLLILPIYWVWKTASHVGVIYALHNGALWPFWRGVGYYTGRGLLIGIVYGTLKILWVVISLIFAALVRSSFPGEVGIFWSLAVLAPFLILTGLAVLDLFQRYARLALIIRHDTVGKAIFTGQSWPIKYGAASYVYLIWYLVALGITLLAFAINAQVHVGVSAVVVGFVVQQVSLFTRSAVTVAWIGSETSLFERTHIAELPLIADTESVIDTGENLA